MAALDRRRVASLFDACLELAPIEREALLDRECGDDAALRAEVEHLLALDATGPDAVAERVARAVAGWGDGHGADEPWRGRRIGAYRLLELLGEGGMGSVFLAARDDAEYDARVAIKLIRGFPTPRALAYLRRERQLLAGLQHPGIARLLDGGTTEAGEPYLVMEYVDGEPLMAWWIRRCPPLRERLELVRVLCEAVHHAHTRLVVHSDIKPGNVLVRADDRPMLLDFGIARLLDANDVTERITVARAYTPLYASPEQLAGDTPGSATDVHALGLLLFELLTGEPMQKPGAGIDLAQRAGATAALSPLAWVRDDAARIRGDLERLVARATAQDPADRYDSAAALARDIACFLEGRPLEAGPDRAAYRIAKLLRRHVLATAMTIAIVVGAIAFGAWLAAERARAVRAESAARVEAATANRVTGFLLDVFRNADPTMARGREPTVREALDAGRSELRTALTEEPLVRARLLSGIGAIYTNIGQTASATETLDEAITLLRADGGRELDLATALNELCRAHESVRAHVSARAACEESLAIRRAGLPPGHVDIAHTLNALGVVDQEDGHEKEADAHFREALSIFEAAGAGAEGDVASTRHNLAYAASRRRDWAFALEAYLRSLEEKRALWGDEHPRTLNTRLGIAHTRLALGRTAEARTGLEELLALRSKVHGGVSVQVADAHNELASLLQDVGDFDDASVHYDAAARLFEALGQERTVSYAVSLNNRATLAEDRGDLAAARGLFERSMALRIALLAPGHPQRVRSVLNATRILLRMGDVSGAAAVFAEIEALPGVRAPSAIEAFDIAMVDAERALLQGRAADAETALLAFEPPVAANEDRRRLRHADIRARAMLALGRPREARDAYAAPFAAITARLGDGHPVQARAAVRAAMLDYAAGDAVAAARVLGVALPVLERSQVDDSPVLARARAWSRALASGAVKLNPAEGF
ncbi:serine/threonine-protein kinase [Dokdonella sp. MW10]|uniref:serine/threonine-protein kinase n=1 Tax=Dokdonella sp. MW10 TaxID=2992926 RepID=UPI003F7DA10C